jgi:hypothetical protein
VVNSPALGDVNDFSRRFVCFYKLRDSVLADLKSLRVFPRTTTHSDRTLPAQVNIVNVVNVRTSRWAHPPTSALARPTHLQVLRVHRHRADEGDRANPAHLVLLCALIPVADTLLMFRFLGVFVGTISILSAALLFLIGGALLPSGAGG